jgi:H+/Cl- antiporter ClcA
MSQQRSVRSTALLVLIAVIGLAVGYPFFIAVRSIVDYLWGTEGLWSGPVPVAFIVITPIVAGALVATIRSRWRGGHDPLAGIQIGPVSARDYPSLIGAVLVSLFGGLVLGPEVALVFTGGAIGTVLGPRLKVPVGTAAVAGAGGAILALFLAPSAGGAASSTAYSYAAPDLVAALIATIATCALIAVSRLIGMMGPAKTVSWAWLLGGGAAVGVIAAAYQVLTDQSVHLVLTSGEQMVKPLLALDSTGLIAATVAVKMVVYGLSVAAGFRGGPYFPVIFAGAGAGAVTAAIIGAGPQAAVTAGIVASVVHLAQAKWSLTIVLGVAIAFLVGGWQLIPVGLAAAALGRVIPRLDRRESTPVVATGS